MNNNEILYFLILVQCPLDYHKSYCLGLKHCAYHYIECHIRNVNVNVNVNVFMY